MVPFELVRGHSWSDAFVLLPDAQKATNEKLLLLLIGIGKGSKLVVSGEPRSDLPTGSGLSTIPRMIGTNITLGAGPSCNGPD